MIPSPRQWDKLYRSEFTSVSFILLILALSYHKNVKYPEFVLFCIYRIPSENALMEIFLIWITWNTSYCKSIVQSHGLSESISMKYPWADVYTQRRNIQGRCLLPKTEIYLAPYESQVTHHTWFVYSDSTILEPLDIDKKGLIDQRKMVLFVLTTDSSAKT